MAPEINEMNLRELLKSYQEVHTKESLGNDEQNYLIRR